MNQELQEFKTSNYTAIHVFRSMLKYIKPKMAALLSTTKALVIAYGPAVGHVLFSFY